MTAKVLEYQGEYWDGAQFGPLNKSLLYSGAYEITNEKTALEKVLSGYCLIKDVEINLVEGE